MSNCFNNHVDRDIGHAGHDACVRCPTHRSV